MVESFRRGCGRLLWRFGCFSLDALLADVFVEALGADAGFYAEIFVDGGCRRLCGQVDVWPLASGNAGRTLTHGGTKDNAEGR